MLHAPLRCSGPLAVWDGIDREGEGRLCWRPSISLRNRFRRKSTRARRDALTERLVVLQQEARAAGVGLVVLFEGWNGAGKGSRISDLMYNLDAAPPACTSPRTSTLSMRRRSRARSTAWAASIP